MTEMQNMSLVPVSPAEKQNNRHHHKCCNGFTGYNGTCIGCNRNGPSGYLQVIGHLLLVAC